VGISEDWKEPMLREVRRDLRIGKRVAQPRDNNPNRNGSGSLFAKHNKKQCRLHILDLFSSPERTDVRVDKVFSAIILELMPLKAAAVTYVHGKNSRSLSSQNQLRHAPWG
jgi:hypothetical protein